MNNRHDRESKFHIFALSAIGVVTLLIILFYAGLYESWSRIPKEKVQYMDDSYEYNGETSSSADTTPTDVLPSIYITTSGETITKETYLESSITVSDNDGEMILDDAPANIKGRGNSTWDLLGEKKPYRIKFHKKQNLFGLGKTKSYVLLANQMDNTLLRNEIAFGLAHAMKMAYTPNYKQVHLFINDSYEGVYLLCEHIDTGSSGVDIETDDGDTINELTDVGFFLEYGGDIDDTHFYFEIVNNSSYNWNPSFSGEIKYPETENLTYERINYISAYVNRLNNAILLKDWNVITELADIPSLVDYFLINEIMLNGDMGWSMYMYKPAGDVLYFGPPWDFDQTSGNSTFGAETHEGFNVPTGCENRWFQALIEIPAFKELASKRYKEIYGIVHEIPDTINNLAEHYHADFSKNFLRWDIIGKDRWRQPLAVLKLKTYDENVDYLVDWFKKRIAWLDNNLISIQTK